MSKDQTLHLKFEFADALSSKKNILNAEMNLINLSQRLENYLNLRRKELDKKIELRNNIKRIVLEISVLLREMPQVAEEETKFQKEAEKIARTENKDKKTKKIIEFELREIKRKLKELEEI